MTICCIKILIFGSVDSIFTNGETVKEVFMKRFLLPLSSLLLIVACGEDSSSLLDAWSENLSSSLASSSSWSGAIGSSNSKIDGGSRSTSSGQAPAAMTSSSRHSGLDPESSSSWIASSSSNFQNDNSSSSIAAPSSSSRNDVSSSSQRVILSSSEGSSSSSSSEILADPSKIFELRVPKRDAYTCEEKGDWGDRVFTETFPQNDFVCTYDYDGEKGFLYVQLSPISCSFGLSLTPNYDVDKAELYVNGKFVDISDVKYEWGGNHHVQKLWFTYKGKVFRYGQSSLGFGGRPCQGMDCLNVFESDRKTYVVNGCDEQRAIPIVCNGVNEENPVFDFTDTFKVCDGDSRN